MELVSLQSLALQAAQERSVQAVLDRIVAGLVAMPGIALARIWLRAPGDICGKCPMRLKCPDQTECLHLAASGGNPSKPGIENWTRLDGDFRRFPLGALKIGTIGATGTPMLLPDITVDQPWIMHPKWAIREGIRVFAGQPLIFRNEILGVLGIFSRRPLDEAEFSWLRILADHAAVAMANSRAFAEIERLRDQLRLENEYLREEVRQERAFSDIVGQSPALQKLLEQIGLVAPTDANVLILGESGTGKELIACAIHDRSRRAHAAMVKVNCAAIPRDLFESEFFGHARGAFTGAHRDRVGRFELAAGGTLFLDEVSEIPIELQGKLLRVLQEGSFERVGEEHTRRVDVRVVAASNRDLRREVENGTFRQDLYFRLSVFPLEVPSLRDRREDIPLLVRHVIDTARRQGRSRDLQIDAAQMARLARYDWPGNVRELQNVIERAIILTRGGSRPLDLEQLLPVERESASQPPDAAPAGESRAFVPQAEWQRRERENVMAALEAADWRIYGPGGAAALLGIKPTTLASRLRTMNIRKLRG